MLYGIGLLAFLLMNGGPVAQGLFLFRMLAKTLQWHGRRQVRGRRGPDPVLRLACMRAVPP
jgi:hypothetical protein